MQAASQPYERPLALGDLVHLRSVTPELTVAVLHRVHGSSLWETIESGQRIRVAPKIGKNLKVVVSSTVPVFDLLARPEAHQLLLLQNTRYDANSSQQKEAFRVGSIDGNRCVEITLPSAPLQPQCATRIEFDAKLLALNKGFRFFARVESILAARVVCGASTEFVAHNSGSSRDTNEPKRKAVKAKPKKKVKPSVPITPPENISPGIEPAGGSLSDSSSSFHSPSPPPPPQHHPHRYPHHPESYQTVVEMDPMYQNSSSSHPHHQQHYVVKQEQDLYDDENDNWVVVDANLSVDGQVLAYSYNQYSDIRLKTEIADLADALSTIQQLSGKKYYWKDNQSTLLKDAPSISNGGLKTIGLIAQEVQRVLPGAVVMTEEGWLSVEYTALVPVLIEALKAQLNEVKNVKESVLKQLDEVGTHEAQVASALVQLRQRLAAVEPPHKETKKSFPTKKTKTALGCSPAVLKGIVLGSLLMILLSLGLFLGLWFGWRPNALVGNNPNGPASPTDPNDAAGSPGRLGAPTPTPASTAPTPPPPPSPVPPSLLAAPMDPNAPVAPAPAPKAAPAPAPVPVGSPSSWRNQNYLSNGGYENPDGQNAAKPEAWTFSGSGASWYDYRTNATRRSTEDLLFPLLNTKPELHLGNKAIRFTRTLADRQNNVPVPSVTNAVPIRNILENLAFLNNLSLANLLTGLLRGVNGGFWANWVYAPNNTNPFVSAPDVTRGIKKSSLPSEFICVEVLPQEPRQPAIANFLVEQNKQWTEKLPEATSLWWKMIRKGGSALVYGLNYPARCIAAQTHTERARFLVGTQSLTEQNQIHLIEVNEYASELKRVHMFPHPNEMWSISTSPFEANSFFTVYSNGVEMKASLWKINDEIQRLQEVTQLPVQSPASILKVLWNPSAQHSVISIDHETVRLWDLSGPKEVASFGLAKDTARFTTGCWNPNMPDQFIASHGESISFYDLRTKSKTNMIKTAHYQLVRDIDVNGNQPYYFASGGDDCKVKFWDSRKLEAPLKTLAQHSHWVTQVKYNQYRDAIVATASTDWMVNLWNISSLAFKDPTKTKKAAAAEGSLAQSQQLLSKSELGRRDIAQDHLIRTYQDHEDSVYSICWAWADGENPWLFASTSYDGRVIVNKVPSHEIDAVTTDLENIES